MLSSHPCWERSADALARCLICGSSSPLIAGAIKVCGRCLREGKPRSRQLAVRAHRKPRRDNGLPEAAPRDSNAPACSVCANECQPGEGKRGLCGARGNVGGHIRAIVGTSQKGAASFWHDALPTNCCASWVCPAGNACGFPKYSYAPGVERGFKNLAVAYRGCTFDCLYCQSWQTLSVEKGACHSAKSVADAVDERTSCVCYFGGDPTPQMAHALAASRLMREKARAQGRPLRICFETNGAMRASLLQSAADVALESGGCIKFDLKAHDATVHQALCGAGNERTLENFAALAVRRLERPEVPLVIAATALIPGYVDEEEVAALARFVASLGTDIPLTLLAFFSCHHLADLPNTSVQQAERCLAAARAAGLKRVQVSNRHVLRDAPEEAR
jgi:pyruvate formate lyase activating enzyme